MMVCANGKGFHAVTEQTMAVAPEGANNSLKASVGILSWNVSVRLAAMTCMMEKSYESCTVKLNWGVCGQSV
jgi:hypothetical protein